jgi:hypothetical protein
MKNITLVVLVIFLGGCAVASPQNIDGKYYMGGDSNCARYTVVSDSRIMCMNKAGVGMGFRNAMTDQELEMYQKMMMAQSSQPIVIPQLQQQSQYSNTLTNCYNAFVGGVMCNSSTVHY